MSKRQRGFSIIGLLPLLLFIIAIITVVYSDRDFIEVPEVNVGIVFPSDVNEPGWCREHYNGFMNACNNGNIKTHVLESVPEEAGFITEAIKNLVEKNCRLIFLASFYYADLAKDVISEYKGVHFFVVHSSYELPNMTSYFVRDYQGMYLAGILAGLSTKTNQLGFVAAYKNTESLRQVNAFALGAQKVNPSAKVHLSFTDSWYSPGKTYETAERLIKDKKIDVLTATQSQVSIVQAAKNAGIYCIPDKEFELSSDESILAAVERNWRSEYANLIKFCTRNKIQKYRNYWQGIKEGTIYLMDYSPSVSSETKDAVEKARKKILNGSDVFTGMITDSRGNLICGSGESISDETLISNVDWMVNGVEVYENR